MISLISGIAVFIVTAIVFWSLLPHGETLHRWANTEWEPYVSVAICSGVALSFTMILSGLITLLSST